MLLLNALVVAWFAGLAALALIALAVRRGRATRGDLALVVGLFVIFSTLLFVEVRAWRGW